MNEIFFYHNTTSFGDYVCKDEGTENEPEEVIVSVKKTSFFVWSFDKYDGMDSMRTGAMGNAQASWFTEVQRMGLS